MRRLLTLLLALVLAAGIGTGLAAADPGGDNGGGANTAQAVNTKDGSALFDFAFAVRHVLNGVVDQENSALAYASCNSCETTAIALEIVLVEAPATTVTPQNTAVSVNESCTLCDTFAAAYQFVVGTGGPVHLDHDGIQTLHDLRKEIESWGRQRLTNEQIRAQLPDALAQVKDVLANDLAPDGRAQPHEPDDEGTSTTETTPAQTPTAPAATTEKGTIESTIPTGAEPAPTATTGAATTGP